MSLKVWLPLDGDLRNLGASNVEVTNNGATIDDNGKIGKCYYFNNSVYLNESNYDWSNFNTSQFSLCCWYKEPSPVASGNSQIIAIGTNSGWNNIRIGLLRRTSNGYPLFTISDGSTAIQYNFTATTFSLDNWNHIAVTYNNGELKIYLNGSLNKTGTTTIIPVLNNSQHLGIGAASNGAEKLTGYLNDVRIYDHCLSAAEVHEIAQGLVVHYKLDGFMGGAGDNLLKNSKTFGTGWSGTGTVTANAFENYFSIKYKDNSSGTSYTDAVVYSNVTTVQPGEVYTGSFWAKADTSSHLSCFFYNNTSGVVQVSSIKRSDGTSGNSTDGHSPFTIDNQWRQYWVTWTFGSSGTAATKTFIVCRLNAGQSGISITKVKLEKGDKMTAWTPNSSELGIDTTIVEDSSGYGHNATTPSVLTTTSDTPRYSTATTFDGTNYGDIHDVIFNSDHLASELTWAGWIKREFNDGVTGRRVYYGIIDVFLYTDNNLRFRWVHSNIDYSYSATNTWEPGIIIPHNSWTHIALTFKDGDLKVYINGEYGGHSDRTGNGQYIRTHIGHYLGASSDTANQWIGSISDMRIYTTALLDNDIKLLYNMGMRVDNLGRVHTFEFNETINEKLLKTGILQSNELEETSAQLAKLKENKGWLSPNFIEI